MIASVKFDPCVDCLSNKSYDYLLAIGNKVTIPGKSKTEYYFFQCPKCGHIWQRVVDRGFGGYGSNYKMLTKQ